MQIAPTVIVAVKGDPMIDICISRVTHKMRVGTSSHFPSITGNSVLCVDIVDNTKL